MEKTYEIKELQELMKPYLGANYSVVNYEAKLLGSVGENYCSLILGVTVTVKNEQTSEQKLIHAVAKTCPPNDMMKHMFTMSTKKEIYMYTTILNELKSFQIENGVRETVDFLCELYGSRLSLDHNSSTADENAVLLMENLTYAGFQMGNRFTGFDLETAKLILKELATFHAVPLAYKLYKPREFEEKIMQSLRMSFKENKPPSSPPFDEKTKQRANEKVIRSAIEGDPKCANLESALLQLLNNFKPDFGKAFPISDPFGTLCHQDLWVNNIMIKYENGKPIKLKFVDFQMCQYDSLAKDLVFFLFSSVQVAILKEHYNNLIELYREKFVETLQSLGCSTGIYSMERFHKEMAAVAKTTEMNHIIFMLTPIMAEKGKFKDIEDLKPEELLEWEGTDDYKRRLAEVLLMFKEKEWL